MKNKPVIFYEIKSMGLITLVPFISFLLLLLLSAGVDKFVEFLFVNQIFCSVPVSFWSAYIIYDYLENNGRDLFLSLGRSKLSLIFYKNIVITFLYIIFMIFFSAISQIIFIGKILPSILIANIIQAFFISSFTLLSTIIIKSSMWAVFVQIVYAISFTGLVRELDFLSVYFKDDRAFHVGIGGLLHKGLILSAIIYSITVMILLKKRN
ncbi:MAG: hypothetical protein CSB16_00785 [Clostridiales bacterium]|nr:MAG: hypothetical protein CSB16_00785 [Clostridiales bacterium]